MKQKIKKRATSAIPIIAYEKGDIEPLVKELMGIIEATNWDYKSEFRDLFRMRDKALVSLLLLSGLRISEALELKFSQVREQPRSFLLLSVVTKKRGYVREKIVMPKDGSLGRICVYFEKWFRFLSEQNKTEWLFPSGCAFGLVYSNNLPTCRAHQIMKKTTGYFPHWCRAVYENIYGHIVFGNNPFKLKKCMGVKRIESVVPYVQADYEKDLPKIYLL